MFNHSSSCLCVTGRGSDTDSSGVVSDSKGHLGERDTEQLVVHRTSWYQ